MKTYIFILFFLMISIVSIYSQNFVSREQDILYNDSSVFKYNPSNNCLKLIFKADSNFKIKAIKKNLKQGLIIFVNKEEKILNSQISIIDKIIQIKDSIHSSIIYYHQCLDNTNSYLIEGIDISPSGDYMVMNVAGYEWFGIEFFNLNELEYIRPPENLSYQYFVKWLPENSALVVSENYKWFWMCCDKMTVINLNLKNGLYKTWDLEKSHFVKLTTTYQGSAECLIYQKDTDNGKMEIKSLADFDLREIQDTTKKQN